jgi:hypothetical protein
MRDNLEWIIKKEKEGYTYRMDRYLKVILNKIWLKVREY